MITVYTQPGCEHCVSAKAYLDHFSIPYSEINIRENDEALAAIRAAGHKQVPQLYVGRELLVEGGNMGLQLLTVEEINERVAILTAAQ